jgi:tetratricopeptide (TPR) repeat protein
MNHLLRAMGFWVWGLLAIGLSVTIVSVGSRLGTFGRAYSSQPPRSVTSGPSTNRAEKTETTNPSIANSPVDAAPNASEVGASTSPPASSGPMISRAIAREMTAAQQAMHESRWADAIRNLEAAQAKDSGEKSPLNAFDQKTIYDFEGFAYIKLNNLGAAQSAYEAAVSTHAYTPADLVKTFRILFRLAASNKRYAKAIEYGKQVDAVSRMNADDLAVMSQLYYLEKDCAESVSWGNKSQGAARAAGQPLKENIFLFRLKCADDAGNVPEKVAALYDLVRLTNKTEYWNNLLRLERQDERKDHNTLMIYRVMYDTHSMNADTDYIEMAQLLSDAGQFREAAVVLNAVMTSPLMRSEHRERTGRLLDAVTQRAAKDTEPARVDVVSAGVADTGIESKFAFSMAKNRAIDLGIGNSQLKDADEVLVFLGRAEAARGNINAARKAFAMLSELGDTSPRVASLWTLYGETLTEPKNPS